MKDVDCIFCNADSKDFDPDRLVYQDDAIVIFLSIMPINPGHVLVIPADHYETIWDTPDDILSKLIITVKRLAAIVKEVTKADGINIGVNNGRAAGQTVNHVHFHIVPRYVNDGLEFTPSRPANREELLKYTELIKARFML